MNMHELANLAASRAQEMQFPLPPPPSASSTAPGTDKVLDKSYLKGRSLIKEKNKIIKVETIC